MENPVWFTLITGAFIFIIVATGIVLKQTGSPYKTIWITLHKLISVAFIILFILGLIKRYRIVPVTTLEVVGLTIFGLSLITALLTGGILSYKNEKIYVLTVAHILSTILLATAMFLIISGFFTS